MKDISENNSVNKDLRQLAEDKLKADRPTSDAILNDSELMKLVHELDVHRIELDMQNEELRVAQMDAQRVNDLYEFAPTGYFTLSPEGAILRLNLSAAAFLEKERPVLIESRLGFFITDETKPIFNHFLSQACQQTEALSCEIALQNSSNQPVLVYLTGKMDKDKKQCLVTMVDITEHKKKEETLKQERQLYLDMVNNQPAGIYRIRVYPRKDWRKNAWNSSENPPYKMELASDRFCEILGITREDFEGNTGMIIDLVHPQDRIEFVKKNEDANASVIPFNWEGRLVIKGKIRWIHLESIPRHVANGDVVWTGILYDISDQKQKEIDLKESETKYRELVDNSPDAICIYSDRKIVFVNNECIRLMKAANAEELLGKDVLEFIHPDSREFAIRRMMNVLDHGNVQPLEEERFLQVDGSAIDVEVKSMPIEYQHKKSIQLIFQDISVRKIAENEIRKSREAFKDLFDFAPLGYHEIDAEGRIVRVNQTELSLMGYTREEVVGQYVWEFNVYQEHSLKSTLDKLQGRQVSSKPYERVLVKKDGSWITVLKQDKMLRAGNGSITGIRTSVQDITDRKQAETDLQASEEKFRQVFENSMIGKSMTSMDGKMNANKAFTQIIGYSKEELSLLKWTDITHPEDIEFNRNEIESIVQGKKDFSNWEKRYIHKSGNIVWANISIFLLRDKDGKPLHFITEIYDITDRKQIETDLRYSEDKFKKAFMTSTDSININRMDDGLYLSVNPGFTRIMGYTEQEILGKTSKEITIWENRADRNRLVQGLQEKGYVENLVAQFRNKTGETVYGMMSATLIELEGKDYILSITRDITAIKKTELALHQSEERFKVLFEDAPDTMFLAEPKTGKIIDANAAACRLFKKDKLELIGMYQYELHPLDKNEFSKQTYKNHILQSKLLDITHPVENVILCSDGTEIPVEILAQSIVIDGESFIVGTFRDISQRKKTEQDLHDSEELYRNLVIRIPDGVYKSTTSGRFVDVNPAMVKMLGYTSKEELMEIDIKTQLYCDVNDRDYRSLNDQNEEMSVFPLKKKDGSVIWIEDHGWYNRDNAGDIVTHEGVLRDITDRKLAQDALQESESMLKKTLVKSSGLIDSTSQGIDYAKMSDTILEISGANYVCFNIYDDKGIDFTTVAISGNKEHIKKASSVLGFEILNKKWKTDPLRKEKTRNESITKYESFYELTHYSIPKNIAALVMRTFHIGDSVVVKITKRNKVIGDFTLIYSNGDTLKNNDLVLLYANQVALFIDRDKTDKALRRNEEKFRYLFANNPQPMWIYDLDTLVILEVNNAALACYGYERDEFLALSMNDLHPLGEMSAFESKIEQARKGEYTNGLSKHKKKNGQEIYVEVTGVAAPTIALNARHVLIQDVTQRKLAEEALLESEDKYRTMIENSNDLIWVLDKEGLFTFMNEMALKTTGFKQEDWIGESYMPLIFSEDNSYVAEIFNRTLLGENCTYELRLKKTDGNVLVLSVNTSPIYISGKIAGVVSFGQDITESKKAFGLLQESEEKFRSITEQTVDLISITDAKGKLIYASTASKSIFQYEPEEMCGHNFTDFVVKGTEEQAEAVFRRIIETKENINNLEFKMKRKDGSLFYGELNGSSFKYGNNYGTLVVIRDMTERKKAQEELEVRMKELMRFHNLTVDREMTMIELKKEINGLLTKSGENEKYRIVN